MQEEDRLGDLLVRWDEARGQGEELSAKELCADCPELVSELSRRMHSVRAMSWLVESEDEADDFLSLPDFATVAAHADETFLPDTALSVDEFAQAIADSGLMTADQVDDVRQNYACPDTPSLARQMVKDKKLTRYQATVFLEGRDVPLLLDRYIILDAIDSGGMGLVFKALHRSLERVVALKTLPMSAVDSPGKVKRFQREAMAAARLDHPNIVTTHDAYESKGTHFLVMEYVRGDDLAKVVRRRGRLPVGKAVNYLIQAARGLGHAHGEGIIHRDVKPSNLLLNKKGTVKVLDMGLARIEKPDTDTGQTESQNLTQADSAMGTVDYMAPEQALDARTADHRSDIYSLGCTLFYLLIGRSIYGKDTRMKTLLAHRDSAVPSLAELREDVPAELDAVFRKMVAKKPDDRYQSMGDVIAQLQACEIPADELAQPDVAEPADIQDASLTETATVVRTSGEEPSEIGSLTSDHVAGVELRTAGDEPPVGVSSGTPLRSTPGTRPVPKTDSRPLRGKLIAAVALGLVALSAAVMVIRVATDKGEIRISAYDPEIEVTVKRNDQPVDGFQVKQRADGASYYSGDYEIEIVGGMPDGVEIKNETFKLTRGKEVLVEIVRVGQAVPDEMDTPSPKDNTDPVGQAMPDDAMVGSRQAQPDLQESIAPEPPVFPAGILPKPADLPGIGRWNVETARPRGQIFSADWSPDGKQIACGMATGHIRIYDAQTLKLVRIIDNGTTMVYSVTWSPNGTQLATVGTTDDTTIRIWTVSGSLVASFPRTGGDELAWHPSGNLLASCTGGSTGFVDLFEMDGKKQRLDFPGAQTRCLAWSPDGERLAVGGTDGTVRLWSLEEGEWDVLDICDGAKTTVNDVAWHPEGGKLAAALYSSSAPRTVVFDIEGTVLESFEQEDYAYSVDWSHDGTKIVGSDYYSGVYIWPLDGSDTVVSKEHLHLPYNTFVSASSKEDLFLTAGRKDGNLRLYTFDGQPAGTLLGAPIVLDADCNSDGVIASGDGTSQMRFWEHDGRLTQSIDTHTDAVTSVAWHPDGSRIASGDLSGELHIHQSDGELAGTFPTQNTPSVVELRWNHAGDRLAGLCNREGNRLFVWDEDGKPVQSTAASMAYTVSWSPNDDRIALAGPGGVVVWDAAASQSAEIIDRWSFAVAWHATAAKLAIGVHGGVLLSSDSGTEQSMLQNSGPFTSFGFRVTSLSWQPSAERLLTVDVWGRVAVWSVKGDLLSAMWDHRIQQLHTFSPACCWTHDGNHFLTAAFDGTIRYYQADPVEPQWIAVNLPDDKAVTFSPSGDILHGDPEVVEKELVYLVENEQGTIDMLTPAEFQERVKTAAANKDAPAAEPESNE